MINKIKELHIDSKPENENLAPYSIVTKEQLDKANRAYLYKTLNRTKVEIPAKNKAIIQEFCSEQGISLDGDFWDLGELQAQASVTIFGQNDSRLMGQKTEEEKFHMLTELFTLVNNYNDMHRFFGAIDDYSYISLFVGNDGTTYDEDIDIKLYIGKNTIVKPIDIPIPGNSILGEVISNDLSSNLFVDKRTSNIDVYSDYPVISKIPAITSFYDTSYTDRIKEWQQDYSNAISSIFCYDIIECENEDVLFFNISYLKQHTKMFFPSRLFFKKAPKSIKYEINSKHSPEIIIGELII